MVQYKSRPAPASLTQFWTNRETQPENSVYCLYNGARNITVNTSIATILSIKDIMTIPVEAITEALLCFGCKPRFRCWGDAKFATSPSQRKVTFYIDMHSPLPPNGHRRPKPLTIWWSFGAVMGHFTSFSPTDDTYLMWLVRLKDAALVPLSSEQDKLRRLTTRLDRVSFWVRVGLSTVPIYESPVRVSARYGGASWTLEGAKVTKLVIHPTITVWTLYYIRAFWLQYGQTFLSRYEKFRKAYEA